MGHVIIRGHVFTREEKAPFVASGKSLLGALEYNRDTDETKCHECGMWFKGLGWHVTKSHDMDLREYRAAHGIRGSSALCGLRIRESHRVCAKALTVPGKGILSPKRPHPARPRAKSDEWRNEQSRCNAQLLFRIQTTAAQVGHTPSKSDLKAYGLHQTTIRNAFGSIGRAMREAGLEPNGQGKTTDLPRGFPTKDEIKKRWEERMPWPEDYFKSKPPSINSSLSGVK